MEILLRFILCEILAYFIFSALNARFFPRENQPIDGEVDHYFTKESLKDELVNFNIENAKGILERLLLVTGLCFGVNHVVTFFGAIKVGTRLEGAKACKATSNYFVLGNSLSVLMAILVAKVKIF